MSHSTVSVKIAPWAVSKADEAAESGCVFGQRRLHTFKLLVSVFLLLCSGNTLYLTHFMMSLHGDSDVTFVNVGFQQLDLWHGYQIMATNQLVRFRNSGSWGPANLIQAIVLWEKVRLEYVSVWGNRICFMMLPDSI